MRTAELYLLTFGSGRQYIGQTCTSVERRYAQHRRDAARGSTKVMHRAWRKYGPPDVKVLAVASHEYIVDLEPKAIAAFRTRFPHGYNMAHGGEIAPAKAAIVAAKISATKKGTRPSDVSLAAAWAATRGKKWTSEQRQRLSAVMMGHAVSEETRRKLSQILKGRPQPQEAVRKMAISMRGKKHSPETIEKMRRARMGRKNPPESYARGWATRRASKSEII